MKDEINFKYLKVYTPEIFKFSSANDCYKALNNSGLKEGYVVYDNTLLIPYCKIKSDLYLKQIGVNNDHIILDFFKDVIEKYWKE